MQPAGAGEDRLFGAQPLVQREEDFWGDPQVIVWKRRRLAVDGLDATDAAEPTTGRREELALPARVAPRGGGGELQVEDILELRVLAIRHHREVGHIRGGADDAFAVTEAQRQLAVMPRGPHHHRQRLAGEPELERLFCRQLIVATLGLIAVAKNPSAV